MESTVASRGSEMTAESAGPTPQDPPPLPDDALILLPVRGMVLFPGVVLPITIGRPGSLAAAQEAARSDRPIGIVQQRAQEADDPKPNDLHRVGTVAGVMRYVTGQDGTHHVVVQGEQRFRILAFLEGYPYLAARVERYRQEEPQTKEIQALTHQLRTRGLEALELLPQAPAELVQAVRNVGSASMLADLIAGVMDLSMAEKQEILETYDIQRRLQRILELLIYRIEVLRLSKQINEQTRQTLEGRQREAVLREQLNAIQRELGETDTKGEEIAELGRKIDEAGMPGEAERQARRELFRLQRMPEAAAEYGMVRTYLDWLVQLPWRTPTPKHIEIANARRILDEDHYGLDTVKRRILEYLAVRKLAPEGKAPILCFTGPPGVGKTSLGRSIARATSREFARISLGGTHDEAEIRGHRRTYIGALPGTIIQALHRAGTRDPVFMLDEIDKLGLGGVQGDPSSALLEVLDPEQNDAFRDNYLGVPFDLSRVMFIATANVLDAIPGPLRDRMEIIELPGYTQDEKLEIARRYLVDRQRKANGLSADQAKLSDAALQRIIREYTREAGCRNLEREIGAVLRRVAMQVAEGTASHILVGADTLPEMLGPRRFENDVALRTSVSGVATGLAWTAAGGNILFVEASQVPGDGKLILTGQLGDVMKESAQAALSLVKSRSPHRDRKPVGFQATDIHIHVPAGAIPKDGPSAGVAMYMALVSLLTGQPLRSDTAMTGEISLRGLVLPVGGIKEKAVAAAAAGLAQVVLPARNRKELDDIPQTARERLRFVWAETVEDVANAVIERAVDGNGPPAAP